MKRRARKIDTIEAMHIVAAALDAERKRGTAEYEEAKAFEQELIRIWRDQLWNPPICKHCGQTIERKTNPTPKRKVKDE